jgi:exopolyphosphatase/guanosine-5'-triphosphate,3'-diphosphate pyrophosphatase
MVAAHSLKLGTILIEQALRTGIARVQERYLSENIRNTSELLSSELDLAHVRTFVVAGNDARLASFQVGEELNEHCRFMSRKNFIDFAEAIQHYSIDECMQKLKISFAEAEGFVSGVLVCKLLLERTSAAQVIVPLIALREGLLIDLTQGIDSHRQEEFFSQIIASAVNLGRKYHFDEPHNRHVADLCMVLFDALSREHGMTRRERMMLEAAALLHDIGMFIRASAHQLHGQYIVANSEIFGLHREEIGVISNVIRYHRGDPPSPADIDYVALEREGRILVLKMASILRVADALDRGHSQRIKTISVERKSETVILHTGDSRDLSLELMGLEEKAGLFQDVFGYKVILS